MMRLFADHEDAVFGWCPIVSGKRITFVSAIAKSVFKDFCCCHFISSPIIALDAITFTC